LFILGLSCEATGVLGVEGGILGLREELFTPWVPLTDGERAGPLWGVPANLGLVRATLVLLSLDPVLPLVARLLLLLFPPPGGGPLFPTPGSVLPTPGFSKSRHFLTKLLARLARILSEVFLLSSLICFPSLVAWIMHKVYKLFMVASDLPPALLLTYGSFQAPQ